MNKSLEKIRDIKSLINEVYDDRKCQGELTEGARKSWLCFKQYCDDIKQDLERLETLEKENKEKDEIIADLEQMYKTASNNYSKLNDKRKKLEKVIDLLDTALDLELENSEEWGKMIYFINSNGGSTLKKENYDLLKEFINEVLNDE